MSSKNYEECGYDLDMDFLTISRGYVCHILGEAGMIWTKQPFKTHLAFDGTTCEIGTSTIHFRFWGQR